jgi:hypothetical protein
VLQLFSAIVAHNASQFSQHVESIAQTISSQ